MKAHPWTSPQAAWLGPNDGDADEQEGPDTWPTSPDKQDEPLDDAPPAPLAHAPLAHVHRSVNRAVRRAGLAPAA